MRTLVIAVLCLAVAGAASAAPPDSTLNALTGTWAGTVEHDGETQPVALTFDPTDDGKLGISWSAPVVYVDHAMLGRVPVVAADDTVRLGPFVFRWDRTQNTLDGVVPAGLVPYYSMPMHLAKVERFALPARPALGGEERAPRWTYDAGTPLWAGPVYAQGSVFVGGQSGDLVALDARTGAKRWVFRAGGPIRARPRWTRNTLYVQADDGNLYAVDAGSGKERWRARINTGAIERLPFDNPKSRYDRFASDVTVLGSRLYVGTHEGKVLALDPRDGSRVWEFAAGDAVLAAPAVTADKVVFGSFDHFVYSLDTRTGKLLWKRDAHGAVVSTPALTGTRAVIGSRVYDLMGLDLETGDVAWSSYIWMSWIESSATLRDGIAYVGSSDAVAVYAVDAQSGHRVWTTDVHGWAWGQPAVDEQRVYVGTSGQVNYPVPHTGNAVAIDRATGEVLWHHALPAPAEGPFGIPGSPALGAGLVFFSGLDGKVYAFAL